MNSVLASFVALKFAMTVLVINGIGHVSPKHIRKIAAYIKFVENPNKIENIARLVQQKSKAGLQPLLSMIHPKIGDAIARAKKTPEISIHA